MKKLMKRFIAVLCAIQIGLFTPAPAQAGTVENVIGWIEAIVQPWPLPIKASEILALIHIVDICQDTSDTGLMTCLNQASADPVIGPLLESSAGADNLELGLKIYLDLKNSDYVQLIKDGGKPIGCAAAQILTGFDVCGAMDELIAIAGFVGDALGAAGEYAEGWLSDLDYMLTGPTPHLDGAGYYRNWWRPFMRDYVAKGVAGGVNDDTALKPYLPQWVFNNGGSYAEFGFGSALSVNQIRAQCLSYYQGFKDGNGGSYCNANTNTFKDHGKSLIAVSQTEQVFVKVLKVQIDAQNKIWGDKAAQLVKDMQAKYPQEAQQALPDYLLGHQQQYVKSVAGLLGQARANGMCLDEGFECSLGASLGEYQPVVAGGSLASRAEKKWTDSKFANPDQAITAALKEVQVSLQVKLDDFAKKQNTYWQEKHGSANYAKMADAKTQAVNKLTEMSNACKALKGKFDGMGLSGTYAQACSASEPLAGCVKKFANLAYGDYTDDKVTAQFVSQYTALGNQCVSESQKVVNEWVRMDKLHDPFVQGWSNYYSSNFKGDPAKSMVKAGDLAWRLDMAFDACVQDHMTKRTTQSTASFGGGVSMSFQPNAALGTGGAANLAAGAKAAAQKLASAPAAPTPPTIAEDFCRSSGFATADPSFQYVDPSQAFGQSDGNADVPLVRTAEKLALTASVLKDTTGGCVYGTVPGKGEDPYRMVCKTPQNQQQCLSHFTGRDLMNAPHCVFRKDGMVEWPCCSVVSSGPSAAPSGLAEKVGANAAGVSGSNLSGAAMMSGVLGIASAPAHSTDPDAQLKALGCVLTKTGVTGQYNCPAGRAMDICNSLKSQARSSIKVCTQR